MSQTLKAVYQNGTFILGTTLELPEGSEVEITVSIPGLIEPEISDQAIRKELLRTLVNQMRYNPIPANAPRLTREMLHERR